MKTNESWGIDIDFPSHEDAKNFYRAFSGTIRPLAIKNLPTSEEHLF